MSEPKKSKQEQNYEAFLKWSQENAGKATDSVKDAYASNTNADAINAFISKERGRVANNESVKVPAYMVWLVALVVVTFTMMAFPFIIVGVVLGMAIIAKVGCSWFKT